ncbi:MAG: A/G-specific adenine glycosylase [Gammaproteobacteria bacterium]
MHAPAFHERLLAWFDRHGRKDLPWQRDKTPYRVWISETMLQQTQVATVIPYFNAFMARFPDVGTLADAPLDEVLKYWSGLGYYARARNLHKAAGLIAARGDFPDTLDEIRQLPGIGLSTAGAIMSIAYEQSQPILDGNVRRVLARYQAVEGWPGQARVNSRLWELSRQLTPKNRAADYTQAIMDLGAMLCTRRKPGCPACPLNADCQAYLTGRTAELPTPKPGKALPVRQRTFLLLTNTRQHILLEKRDPSGIWGGLWSLPEFDGPEQALAWCSERTVAIIAQQTLAQRRHTFSHYHLDYTPLAILTDGVMNSVREADRLEWHEPCLIEKLGLAAPIKRLLKQFIVKKRMNND